MSLPRRLGSITLSGLIRFRKSVNQRLAGRIGITAPVQLYLEKLTLIGGSLESQGEWAEKLRTFKNTFHRPAAKAPEDRIPPAKIRMQIPPRRAGPYFEP